MGQQAPAWVPWSQLVGTSMRVSSGLHAELTLLRLCPSASAHASDVPRTPWWLPVHLSILLDPVGSRELRTLFRCYSILVQSVTALMDELHVWVLLQANFKRRFVVS